jgi:hypothetical protein
MTQLTATHLLKFQAHLVLVNEEYYKCGKDDFDIAYRNNMNNEDKTLNEVAFKAELTSLKKVSNERSNILLNQIHPLEKAIIEARRQIEISKHVDFALILIGEIDAS